jgi:hypothetical protein
MKFALAVHGTRGDVELELPYRQYGLMSSAAFRTFCACTDFRLAERGRMGGGP